MTSLAHEPMASPKIIQEKRPSSKSSPISYSQPTITLDLLIYVFSQTLFHPFLAALLPLCLRALGSQYKTTSFIITASFAGFVSFYRIFQWFNQRLAFGWPREMDWRKERVVITGGNSGFGAILAEILSMKHVEVAVLDKAFTLEEDVREKGLEWEVWNYRCDVSDPAAVEKVWQRLADEGFGTPTILINNAAVAYPSTFMSQSLEQVSSTFSANTLSHFHVTKLFLDKLSLDPLASKRGGHVVTVSSVLGHLGAANLSAYTASKAALMAYHASLAAELARVQPLIKTILVAPGQLDTDLFGDVQIQGFVQKFIAPVVESHRLALRVVRLLDQGMGGEIREPFFADMIAWLAVLPDSVRVFLRHWSGLDSSANGGHATDTNGAKAGVQKSTREMEHHDDDDSSSLDDSDEDER